MLSNKAVFSFSIGILVKYLKLTQKSLRRSKKGFLLYLNFIFNVFKKFNFTNTITIINFFDNKLIYFKKRFNNSHFNKYYFIKIKYNCILNFKKHKSIKRRLTKKFLKTL